MSFTLNHFNKDPHEYYTPKPRKPKFIKEHFYSTDYNAGLFAMEHYLNTFYRHVKKYVNPLYLFKAMEYGNKHAIYQMDDFEISKNVKVKFYTPVYNYQHTYLIMTKQAICPSYKFHGLRETTQEVADLIFIQIMGVEPHIVRNEYLKRNISIEERINALL
jgi:hypothetical protein